MRWACVGGDDEVLFETLSSATRHTCGIKADRTLWCWGDNSESQFGDNTTTNSLTAVQTKGPSGVGFLTDVTHVETSNNYSCALKTDGTVWCWGYNAPGQLGDNTTTNRTAPVQVKGPGGSGTLGGITQMEAQAGTTCGVKGSDQSLWCWGSNSNGRLGIGNETQQNAPVQVKGLNDSGFLTNVLQVTAGNNQHNCAIKTDGSAWCFGDNGFGQLGTNSTTDSWTPVQVVAASGGGMLASVVEIRAGYDHTCARISDGTVWCWGAGTLGQLGNDASTNQSRPVQVQAEPSGNLTGVIRLQAGRDTSCAIKFDKTLWCWGGGGGGQLGIAATGNKNKANQVMGPGGVGYLDNVSTVSVGTNAVCAVKEDKTSWCWGQNTYGNLGDGSTANSLVPVRIAY